MRTCLLILLLTTFISCGKKLNEISSHKGSSAFLSENALIIPHNESGSAIRIKLLNKIVEETFPSTEENPNSIIQIHDELQNAELSESEVRDYEVKEKSFTKVVVSFSDREEVHFVKDRIPTQDLIFTLRLNPEVDRKLKLITSPYSQSFIGATFYIVSVKHEDLMKNDQQFYSAESMISNFQEDIFVGRSSSALIKVNYEFRVQSLAPVVYTAPKVRCSRDSLEDGSCGSGCSYTVNLPVDKYEKTNPSNLRDLGAIIKYGNSKVLVDQFSVSSFKDGYFEMKLDSLETVDEEASFKFLNMAPTTYSRTSAHYNFSSGCSSEDRGRVSSYTQKTEVSLNVKMNVFGRGEELRKIKL